jgi:hypothetical protein
VRERDREREIQRNRWIDSVFTALFYQEEEEEGARERESERER